MTALRAIGPEPTVEMLLLGSLLWSDADAVREVIPDIDPADLDDPHLRPLLEAARALVEKGTPHHGQAVGDELQRTGRLGGEAGRLTVRRLGDAMTCGAAANNLAPRVYASLVAADAYRRRIELAGKVLVEAAQDAPEDDLFPLMQRLGTEIRNHAERLARLRGGVRVHP